MVQAIGNIHFPPVRLAVFPMNNTSLVRAREMIRVHGRILDGVYDECIVEWDLSIAIGAPLASGTKSFMHF